MTESLPSAVDAERLTEVLRRCGVLDGGRVSEVVTQSSRDTILSRIVRLRLAYDGVADGAPISLILKTGLPGRIGSGWNPGRQEVAFYTQVASSMTTRLVPRCFEAYCDDKDQSTWHLLLEDLSDSHVIATAWPLPPTIEQCQIIVRTRSLSRGVVGRSSSGHHGRIVDRQRCHGALSATPGGGGEPLYRSPRRPPAARAP